MQNNFGDTQGDQTSPAKYAAAVTPNDGTDLAVPARALYVGGTGDLKVDTAGGDTVTFSGVTAGSFIPVMVSRVYATGTTATNILSLA
jgi:hypothetical protein